MGNMTSSLGQQGILLNVSCMYLTLFRGQTYLTRKVCRNGSKDVLRSKHADERRPYMLNITTVDTKIPVILCARSWPKLSIWYGPLRQPSAEGLGPDLHERLLASLQQVSKVMNCTPVDFPKVSTSIQLATFQLIFPVSGIVCTLRSCIEFSSCIQCAVQS